MMARLSYSNLKSFLTGIAGPSQFTVNNVGVVVDMSTVRNHVNESRLAWC